MSTPAGEGSAKPGGGRKKDPLKSKRDELYTRCLERFSTNVFNQTDLVGLGVAKDLTELLTLCQELAGANMFQIMTMDGAVCYKARRKDDADKLKQLDAKDFLVYGQIESTGLAGMWTKTLKARTNLHQTVLNRSIKALETANLIKQIKSIKFPGRKIYMLYELNPGEEVTGGPWFSEGELDVDFIELIGGLITEYVKNTSWREGPKPPKPLLPVPASTRNNSSNKKQPQAVAPNVTNDTNDPTTPTPPPLATYPHSLPALSSRGRILVPHPPSYQGYPTASKILDWIDSKGVIQGKDLTITDLTHLLDVLVFDKRLERMGKRSSANATSESSSEDNDDDVDVEHADDDEAAVIDGDAEDARAKTRSPPAPTPDAPDDMYRWVRVPGGEDGERGPGNGFSETPCSRCPVFRLCEEGGPVDARSCGYFDEWLAV